MLVPVRWNRFSFNFTALTKEDPREQKLKWKQFSLTDVLTVIFFVLFLNGLCRHKSWMRCNLLYYRNFLTHIHFWCVCVIVCVWMIAFLSYCILFYPFILSVPLTQRLGEKNVGLSLQHSVEAICTPTWGSGNIGNHYRGGKKPSGHSVYSWVTTIALCHSNTHTQTHTHMSCHMLI